jgi:hypothetical protein
MIRSVPDLRLVPDGRSAWPLATQNLKQERDVSAAVARRRQEDLRNIQTVVEVGAE